MLNSYERVFWDKRLQNHKKILQKIGTRMNLQAKAEKDIAQKQHDAIEKKAKSVLFTQKEQLMKIRSSNLQLLKKLSEIDQRNITTVSARYNYLLECNDIRCVSLENDSSRFLSRKVQQSVKIQDKLDSITKENERLSLAIKNTKPSVKSNTFIPKISSQPKQFISNEINGFNFNLANLLIKQRIAEKRKDQNIIIDNQ